MRSASNVTCARSRRRARGRGRRLIAEQAAAEHEQDFVARRAPHLVRRAHALHGGPLVQVLLERCGIIVDQVLLERALRVVRRVDAAIGAAPPAAVYLRRALDAQANRADGPTVDRLALLHEDLVAHALIRAAVAPALDKSRELGAVVTLVAVLERRRILRNKQL